ncbi:MAG: DUF4276 family protein [Magnetospirillum sp. WYHS-4]
MKEIVCLVEEPSMKAVLDALLPRILPRDVKITTIGHQGKNDLEKSVPRKLRAWANPEALFVVMRDNGGGDCSLLKGKLLSLCDGPRRSRSLVRIVCQELESWFLGDLAAVDRSGLPGTGRLARDQGRKKFADPDRLVNAKEELRKLVPAYYPESGAKAIAPHLAIEGNRSQSFVVFVAGVRNLLTN